jgi:hypothetical protein
VQPFWVSIVINRIIKECVQVSTRLAYSREILGSNAYPASDSYNPPSATSFAAWHSFRIISRSKQANYKFYAEYIKFRFSGFFTNCSSLLSSLLSRSLTNNICTSETIVKQYRNEPHSSALRNIFAILNARIKIYQRVRKYWIALVPKMIMRCL